MQAWPTHAAAYTRTASAGRIHQNNSPIPDMLRPVAALREGGMRHSPTPVSAWQIRGLLLCERKTDSLDPQRRSTMRVLAGVLFLAGLLAISSLSSAQPPGGGKG